MIYLCSILMKYNSQLHTNMQRAAVQMSVLTLWSAECVSCFPNETPASSDTGPRVKLESNSGFWYFVCVKRRRRKKKERRESNVKPITRSLSQMSFANILHMVWKECAMARSRRRQKKLLHLSRSEPSEKSSGMHLSLVITRRYPLFLLLFMMCRVWCGC